MEKFIHNGKRFSRRKDCKHVRYIKKDLNTLNPNDLNLLEGTQLSTNDSLYPFEKGLE